MMVPGNEFDSVKMILPFHYRQTWLEIFSESPNLMERHPMLKFLDAMQKGKRAVLKGEEGASDSTSSIAYCDMTMRMKKVRREWKSKSKPRKSLLVQYTLI
jgi:hypothetical protein